MNLRIGMKAPMIASLIVSLMASTAALAQGRRFGNQDILRMRLSQALQFTDDQKAQIKSIVSKERQRLRPLLQQLTEKQTAFMQATRTVPLDDATVRFRAQDVATTRADLMVARAHVRNQVLSVLTDDQKSKLSELRKQRHQRWHERHPQIQGG
jgi:Spy/CpxP family protein refolding chaperone